MRASSRILAVSALVGAVTLATTGAVPATAAPPTPDVGPAASATPAIRALMRGMSVEQKVGQLFVGFAYGATADTQVPDEVEKNRRLFGADNAAALVETHHVGGMIYFGNKGNVKDASQIAQLSNDLQSAATTTGAEIPLLISTDEEGGYVTRIPAPFASSPGNMAIGAGFSAERAYSTARATGEQLRALGIRVNAAPVVDVNTNPANQAVEARAFSDTTSQVSVYGGEAVHGLQHTDVAATLKHFPGLGSVRANTDDDIAVSDQTKAEFIERDLPAFAAAIEAGADGVMVGHLVAPALDPSRAPASLSTPIVTDLLRKRLGFDGVVITDALNAGALRDYSDAELAVGAIQAGVDQLLMPRYLPDAVAAVVGAVESGQITTSRLNASVARILELKQRLGLFAEHTVDPEAAPARIGTTAQLETMADAARHGVTLHRNDGTLPRTAAPHLKIAVIGWGTNATTALTKLLDDRGYAGTRVHTGDDPEDTAIENAVTKAKERDLAIVLSRGPWTTDAQRKLITRVHATGVPTVVLSVGAPYELAALPDDIPFLSAYGYERPNLDAAVDVIFGAQPLGRSPITITDDDGAAIAPYRSGLRYE